MQEADRYVTVVDAATVDEAVAKVLAERGGSRNPYSATLTVHASLVGGT